MNKKLWRKIMTIMLLASVALYFLACKDSQKQSGEVKIAFVFGAVEKVDAEGNATPLKAGQILVPTDSVRTKASAFVDLMFAETSKVRLKENTTMKISSLIKDGNAATDLTLYSGKMMASPGKLKKNESFMVNTPTAVAGVRGTKFAIEVNPDKSTALSVTEGKVWVKKNLPALDNKIVDQSKILTDIKNNNEQGFIVEPKQAVFIEAKEVLSENMAIENLVNAAIVYNEKNKQNAKAIAGSEQIDNHLKQLLNIQNGNVFSQQAVKEIKLSVLEFISKSEVQELDRLDNQATLETVKKSYSNDVVVADNKKIDTENTNYIIKQAEEQKLMPSVEWQRNFSKTALNNRPVIYGNLLIFGDKEGNLNAVNRYNGLLTWKVSLGSSISASPLLIDNKIYFGTMKGEFFSANAANGMKYWSVKTGTIVYGSSAAFVDNKIYVGASSGNVTAISDKGEILWQNNIGSGIFSTPVVKNDMIFVGAEDNNLYALKTDKGQIVWKHATGSRIVTSSAVIIGETVFIGSYDKKIYALELKNGKVRWQFETDGLIGTTPVVQGDSIIFATGGGSVYKVNAQKSVVWQTKLNAAIHVHPQLEGNSLIVAADNKVHLLDTQNGTVVKDWQIDDKVAAAPTLSVDKIYVTTQKGNVVALRR